MTWEHFLILFSSAHIITHCAFEAQISCNAIGLFSQSSLVHNTICLLTRVETNIMN